MASSISLCVCSVVSDSLRPHGLKPTRLLVPWISQEEYGAVCHFLLQGIFLTQEWKLRILYLLRWQADPLPRSHREALVSPVTIRRK